MDWGYKAVLTATTVALLLLAAQSFGRRLAGALAGLPTVTGPALIWLALEFGASYAVEAAIGSVAACAACAIFAFAYERASRRGGVMAALTLATVASVLAVPPLHWMASGLAVVLLVSAVSAYLVYVAMPDGRDRAGPVRRLRGELWFTAIVSGFVSGAVALAAPSLSAFWAGVLASPPLIAAAVAVHQHAFVGHASVQRFLRGYVAGLLGRAVFAAAFALLIVRLGAATASLVAIAAGCIFTMATMHLERFYALRARANAPIPGMPRH